MRKCKEKFGSNFPADFVLLDCDRDGYFQLFQSNPMIGRFCVDKYTGKRTSRFSKGLGLPNCPKSLLTVSSHGEINLSLTRKAPPTSQSTSKRMTQFTTQSIIPSKLFEVYSHDASLNVVYRNIFLSRSIVAV